MTYWQPKLFLSIATLTLLAIRIEAQCIPFTDAGQHIGETHCVSGKIFHVKQDRGVTLLDFCAESETCPFSAVVFSRNLKQVGDVRDLQGKNVEIHGTVKEYQGRPEIIVERAKQIGGDGARLPALPKTYDVEQRGHYSAGTFSLPHATSAKAKKKQAPTYPVEIGADPD